MEVRKLDVVGVVVASVVDEAVDGVDDDPGDALVAVRLHLHAVGSQDADHTLDVALKLIGSFRVGMEPCSFSAIANNLQNNVYIII